MFGQKFIVLQLESEVGEGINLILTTSYQPTRRSDNCGSDTQPLPCPPPCKTQRVEVTGKTNQTVKYSVIHKETKGNFIGTVDYANYDNHTFHVQTVAGGHEDKVVAFVLESERGHGVHSMFEFYGYWRQNEH